MIKLNPKKSIKDLAFFLKKKWLCSTYFSSRRLLISFKKKQQFCSLLQIFWGHIPSVAHSGPYIEGHISTTSIHHPSLLHLVSFPLCSFLVFFLRFFYLLLFLNVPLPFAVFVMHSCFALKIRVCR